MVMACQQIDDETRIEEGLRESTYLHISAAAPATCGQLCKIGAKVVHHVRAERKPHDKRTDVCGLNLRHAGSAQSAHTRTHGSA